MIEKIADTENLYLAFKKACRGKRRKKEVRAFCDNFDANIARLRWQILTGNVDVGRYHYFTIKDPKERLICAASFQERVLHHAIMNVCHECFDRRLISDTYATRPGKGIYAALEKACRAAAKYRYIVKLDFRKYYDSITHDTLKEKLADMFKDPGLLSIFGRIIDSYHGDSGYGLPIGNLTSQYFANIYLSGLDHWAKEKLRLPVYIRYMDDILIAGSDKDDLLNCARKLSGYADKELGLVLKPPECNMSTVGIIFLGYRVLPGHLSLSGRSKRRFRTKLLKYERYLDDGYWTEQDYAEHILPLLAFTGHADSAAFRCSCMEIIEGNGREVGPTA